MWLGRYCAPGTHSFQQLRMDVRVCERCLKEELLSGATCLVCTIPGEVEATLRHAGNPGQSAQGLLCGSCLEEFGKRYAIKGWTIQLAA